MTECVVGPCQYMLDGQARPSQGFKGRMHVSVSVRKCTWGMVARWAGSATRMASRRARASGVNHLVGM